MSDGLNPWILPGLVGAAVIGAAALLLRPPPEPPEKAPPPARKRAQAPVGKTESSPEQVGPQPKPREKLAQLAGVVRALKEEPNPTRRAQAAGYIGSHAKHCGLEELQVLRTALVDDAAPEVRAAAATALGRFGERAAPAREALKKASKRDREKRVREAAQAALATIDASRQPR